MTTPPMTRDSVLSVAPDLITMWFSANDPRVLVWQMMCA